MVDTGLRIERHSPADTIVLALNGDWKLADGLRSDSEILKVLGSRVKRVTFKADTLGTWDSTLVAFLLRLHDNCGKAGAELDLSGLPDGVRRLFQLATTVPEQTGTNLAEKNLSYVEAVGTRVLRGFDSAQASIVFLGEAIVALGRFLMRRARCRKLDFWVEIEKAGTQALPIVTVISLLIGLILAFVGAVQLRQFGASIYVANLVAVAVLREMGAIMTAIVVAGRTGAAYAAELGAMQGNEEIDALMTLGIPPMEFLVLPRMVALVMMMPLLCLYADFMGIIGGYLVSSAMLDVTTASYFLQTQAAASLSDLAIGLVKSAVFGVLIAVAGCMRGVQCGRSAIAVGHAATSAVVTGILYIIVADALFAVVLDVLGI